MRRRMSTYFKGGTLVFGILFSIWGFILTIKSDKRTIGIQARYLWLALFVISIIVLFLMLALYNQDKKLREIDEYHIERCYNDKGVIRIIVAFIPILVFDYAVSIATENSGREEVIGIGKVINVKPNSYIEIEMIRRVDNQLWQGIEANDKKVLNSVYVLPTVHEKEINHE